MVVREARTAVRGAGTEAKEATGVMPTTPISPALTSSRRPHPRHATLSVFYGCYETLPYIVARMTCE